MGRTGGSEQEHDRKYNDIPRVAPDHEQAVCHERVADEGHRDVDDILRNVRRVVQRSVEFQRAVRFTTLDYEALDRPLDV